MLFKFQILDCWSFRPLSKLVLSALNKKRANRIRVLKIARLLSWKKQIKRTKKCHGSVKFFFELNGFIYTGFRILFIFCYGETCKEEEKSSYMWLMRIKAKNKNEAVIIIKMSMIVRVERRKEKWIRRINSERKKMDR